MRIATFAAWISAGSLALLAAAQNQNPQDWSKQWTQLSWSTCKVDQFLRERPNSDGRGVVIAVLDTGVDPSIPGLTTNPDGSVKVIDMQDFTGQGDVALRWMTRAGDKLIATDDDGNPIEFEPPAFESGELPRRWWIGTFDERRFINSAVSDLNDDGTTDDEWAVLVTHLEGDRDDLAVCYIDTDQDRSFADEKPLKNYHLNYDTFTLGRDKPEQQGVPVTFGLNIFLRQAKVVIHWDDGAHGTHVAGIAAGYRINNQDDLHGVAPGAHVISMKIGKNSIGGVSVTESKKKAFEYCARFAQQHGVPVVMNLSYGVESEIEGASDIDAFVDDFMQKHPYVIFCTSAGNEGPGLSSVGTPAAANLAISVGALLAADSAADQFGYRIDEAVVTTFSSRGGETNKPDIVTPGWSVSTVPRWVSRGDFWAGTSMASPYAAGLCALLISDAQQNDTGARVSQYALLQALRNSARQPEGWTVHDVGGGIPEMPKAARILTDILAEDDHALLVGYNISTTSPLGHNGRAPAQYWRAAWFPRERQAFTIAPLFGPNADDNAKTQFARQFTLRSNARWIDLPQNTVYLRSSQSARVFVEYDAKRLRKPGVYVGTVDALYNGRVEFQLRCTVVVPHEVGAAEDYAVTLSDQTTSGWLPERHFVAVPPGASSMQLTLRAPAGEQSRARFDYVFNPGGHGYRERGMALDADEGLSEITRTFTDLLTPGVWEIPIFSNRPDETWPYALDVRFFGLHAAPAKITSGSRGRPSGELVVTNMFTKPVHAEAEGRIEGYRQRLEKKFEGLQDVVRVPFTVADGCERVRVMLELEPEHYARTTDIGVEVKDASGEAIWSSAMGNHYLEESFRASGSLTLEITGGFAVADFERKTPITVLIDHMLADPVSVGVTGDTTFIPSVPTKLSYRAAGGLDAPSGTHPVGYLRFKTEHGGVAALEVPLEIGG